MYIVLQLNTRLPFGIKVMQFYYDIHKWRGVMKIKYKISLIVAGIVTAVIVTIAVLLLREASAVSMELSLKGMKYLAIDQATYWKAEEDSKLTILHTLADLMGDYNDIPAANRRDQFDSIIYRTMKSNPDFISLYTVWKPNAIDGMDQTFIGRTGSTDTGQYALSYIWEGGVLTSGVTSDVANAMSYFNGPNSKRDRVDDPHYYWVNGENKIVLRMMVPIVSTRTNETVGGVGILFDIDSIQPKIIQTIAEYEEISALAVFANSGLILGHTMPDHVGKRLMDVEVIFDPNREEAARHVRQGLEYHASAFSTELNADVELIVLPFTIGNSNTTWSIMVVFKDSEIYAHVRDMTITTIITALIANILTVLIVFLIISNLTKPISFVAETLKDIAEGEGDLTHTITVHSKDEIGDLALYFNETLDKIRTMVIHIREEANSLAATGSDLASNMNETAAAVNEITSNIQSVKSRILTQSASVSETHATMEQVTVNISKLNGHVEKQSTNIAQASSAIEEMVANTRSVTETLIKNAANVKTLLDASEVGRNGLHIVSEDIREIARESEGLLEINAMMESIASQTNLLSMNAAIEAAHAGEAGKGFAVVASEIRKLAESSGDQSKTISSVLKKMKESIDKITIATNNVLSKFEAIDSSVKVVAFQEDNIRNAMEEQGVGSKQILEGVGNINIITSDVKRSSQEMLEGSEEVIRESENLEKITHEITSGINEMAIGADEINVAVHHVNEISVKNRENIDLLIKEVSRFKV